MRLLAAAAIFVFIGCAGSTEGTADQNQPADIGWLTASLQDEGVFVESRGTANPSIAADRSNRLVLDGREILDVYEFARGEQAMNSAIEFAGRNPGNDVYVRETLVVIRYTTRATGLSLVLNELLGATVA